MGNKEEQVERLRFNQFSTSRFPGILLPPLQTAHTDSLYPNINSGILIIKHFVCVLIKFRLFYYNTLSNFRKLIY